MLAAWLPISVYGVAGKSHKRHPAVATRWLLHLWDFRLDASPKEAAPNHNAGVGDDEREAVGAGDVDRGRCRGADVLLAHLQISKRVQPMTSLQLALGWLGY